MSGMVITDGGHRPSNFSPDLQGAERDRLIDYPFTDRCSALNLNKTDPSFAKLTKEQIDQLITSIVKDGELVGIPPTTSQWIIDELMTNATQYGAMSESNPRAGLIRVEWGTVENSALAIAVSNPCIKLFDPSQFARMAQDKYFSRVPEDGNAHLGTIRMISELQQGTQLSYLWELRPAGRVLLTLEPYPVDAQDLPDNHENLMAPVRVRAEKFDPNGGALPYDFKQFCSDITNGIAVESVTVSCIISAK